MGQFRDISPSRVSQIKSALKEAQQDGKGIAVNPDTNEISVASVNVSPDDKRNVLGKQKRHFNA